MYGKLKFNLLFGAFGFVITLLISFAHNFFITSLIRGFIAFIAWFLLAFAIRWIWGLPGAGPSGKPVEDVREEGEKGSLVDLTTPDEIEDMNDLLKPSDKQEAAPRASNPDFEPLNPPRLVKTTDRSTEEMVKAVRHLTEE